MLSYLVRTRGDLQFAGLLVISEPAPARALNKYQIVVVVICILFTVTREKCSMNCYLDCHGGGTELSFHVLEAAKVSVDGIGQSPGGLPGPARAQVLPEDGVVEVAAAIELDGALEADGRGHVALGRGLGELLLGHVEVVDVGGVVLAVVQLHDLGADDRLQRIVIVTEILLVGTRYEQKILRTNPTGGRVECACCGHY